MLNIKTHYHPSKPSHLLTFLEVKHFRVGSNTDSGLPLKCAWWIVTHAMLRCSTLETSPWGKLNSSFQVMNLVQALGSREPVESIVYWSVFHYVTIDRVIHISSLPAKLYFARRESNSVGQVLHHTGNSVSECSPVCQLLKIEYTYNTRITSLA